MVIIIKFFKIRICIDLRYLNMVIKCEYYLMKIIEEVVVEIFGVKVFFILDESSDFSRLS